MKTKQVIVMIRRFPLDDGKTISLRMGKMVAQGSHASSSLAVQTLNTLRKASLFQRVSIAFSYIFGWNFGLREEFFHWAQSGNAKICLRVETLDELLKIQQDALSEGLEVHIITDSGLTELGKPTITCLAIGPDQVEKIDKVTKHLELL